MESADKYAEDLKQEVDVKPVNTIKTYLQQIHNSTRLCYRCGGKHQATNCHFKEAECYACRKKGHIAKVCRSKSKGTRFVPQQSEKTHKVESHDLDADEPEPDAAEYKLFTISSHKNAPIMIEFLANGQPLQMELDTGASISLISEQQYKQLQGAPPLEKSSVILRTYTGENLSILGSIRVVATYNNQTNNLPLLVVKGNGPNLMGRDWLARFKVDWHRIHQLQSSDKLNDLLTKFDSIFKDELGTVKEVKAHIKTASRSFTKHVRFL